jgi:hypothetical protein
MRSVTIALSLLVSSTSLLAQLQALGTDGTTVRDLMMKVRESRVARRSATGGKVKPNVVSVDWGKESFIIPVAGSVQGSNGTFFKSDVSFANRRAIPQKISVGYLARGLSNAAETVTDFTIAPNETVIEIDFVGNRLGKTGLGTLLVVARTPSGAVDDLAEIDGFSRIWTPQPPLAGQLASAGTVSQSFESIDVEDNFGTSYGYGLRQDELFRTNVGLVNLHDTSNTFTIDVIGVRGTAQFTQMVLPYSMEQPALPPGIYGDLYVRISSAVSDSRSWSGYGTSVDNRTGDGWVSHVH